MMQFWFSCLQANNNFQLDLIRQLAWCTNTNAEGLSVIHEHHLCMNVRVLPQTPW